MEQGNLSNVEWFRGIGEQDRLGAGLAHGAVGRLKAPQGINPERKVNMALTRDFKETVAARVQNDPAFAQALLDEAITLFVNGEPESAKLILRDLVNATVGFEALAEEIHKPAKSLHRMLSKSGNPTMSNISAVFAAIKRALKVEVHTQIVMA
jgi:DNA-binding phage protein